MNAISKVRLRSVLLGNKPRGRTGQRGSIRLVERRQGSSDKARLNVLRSVDARWGGVGPSTGRSNKTARDLKTGAGTIQDDKGVGVPGRAGRGNNQVGDPRQDDKGAGDPGQETEAGRDDKRAAEPAAGARTRAWRLSSRAFLLATRLFYFLIFSSSESVIGWPLSTGSIVRSGLSVTSTNRNAPSSR